MVTTGAKRKAVAHAREHHGLSERRACSLVGVSRRVIRYHPTSGDDAPLRARLREPVAERRRFGYRRLSYLLIGGLAPNQRWSLDFVSDTLASSRRFRFLCVVHDYTRE